MPPRSTRRCQSWQRWRDRCRSIWSWRPRRGGSSPARKPGKLPSETVSAEYVLEYGIDALEMHADALAGGIRVLVHDDLLATGGTAAAVCKLVEELGAVVAGCAFLVELSFLDGRARLAPHEVLTVIEYTG